MTLLDSIRSGSVLALVAGWTGTIDAQCVVGQFQDGASSDSLGVAGSIEGSVGVLGAAPTWTWSGPIISGNSVLVLEPSVLGWVPTQSLRAPGFSNKDRFGASVDTDGTTIVVGAPDEDGPTRYLPDEGAAYVFQRGTSSWVRLPKLKHPTPAIHDHFGASVAVSGGRIVVAATHDDDMRSESGSLHVFDLVGTSWVHSAKLNAPALPSLGKYLGRSLDLDGDRIVASIPSADVAGQNAGIVLVWELVGTTWTLTDQVLPPPGSTSLGTRVVLKGDRLAALAPNDPAAGGAIGRIHVYERLASGWTHVAALAVSDPAALAVGGGIAHFDLEGDRILAGVPAVDSRTTPVVAAAGACYLFELGASGWVERARIDNPVPHANDGMGFPHLGADVAFLAAPYRRTGALGGLAFVTDLSPLCSSQGSISVSAGGKQTLEVLAPIDHAGQRYMILGTAGGTTPGFAVGGWIVPLNLGPYLAFTAVNPNSPFLTGSYGNLSGTASARSRFWLPPGSFPSLAGLTLHHAFGVFSPPGFQLSFVSNATPIRILP